MLQNHQMHYIYNDAVLLTMHAQNTANKHSCMICVPAVSKWYFQLQLTLDGLMGENHSRGLRYGKG